MVPQPHEARGHAAAQWHGVVPPEGPFASSSSLDGSFPRFALGYEIPIIQTSVCDIGGSDIGGASMNNIGISWSPSSSFIGVSPSTTPESRNASQALYTSDFSYQHSPTGLQQSSVGAARSRHNHLGYLRVSEREVRRDNFASSEVSQFIGNIPRRVADEGNQSTKSTRKRLATMVPTLGVPVASEVRERLVAAHQHHTSASTGDQSGRSLLSLTRPQPFAPADVRQSLAQSSIPALSPSLDSLCGSPWGIEDSSLLGGVTSPQSIFPGLLNLGPTVHGSSQGTSKQRSTPSSAPHPATSRPLLGFPTLQFNPSTWPMVSENRVEPQRNRAVTAGDVATNCPILMTVNDLRSLAPDKRPNSREVSSKGQPRSSLSLHPDSQMQPATEFGAKAADNGIGITDPKDPHPLHLPARDIGGISLGLIPPITQSTGLVSSLGQPSMSLNYATGGAEISSDNLAHYFEVHAVGQPAFQRSYQGTQTNFSGDRNYITQNSSESCGFLDEVCRTTTESPLM